MKKNKIAVNIITAVLYQVITLILGFIIPSITINNYGSETNGFISTVSQIYSYLALLEAGLGTAAIQALYPPVASGDKKQISLIINSAKAYYIKISIIYSGTVLLISIILPFVLESTIKPSVMISYFLLFGVSNVMNFAFTASMKPLLNAEGKLYVSNNICIIFHTVCQLSKVILLNLKVSILTLQLATSIINVLQIAVYYIYFKKRYPWIDKTIKPRKNLLKQRSAFLLQQISQLLFSSTDVVIISVFCGLVWSSIYSVYMLIYNVVNTLLSMLTGSFDFVLGQTYSKDKETYLFLHRSYELVLITVATVIYTVVGVVCTPFIELYTANISDVNYIYPELPILFSIMGLLTTIRSLPVKLLNFSFYAKQTMYQVVIEVILNIIFSVIFVNAIGMSGVLVGTIIALIYRNFVSVRYSNNIVLGISNFDSIKIYFINIVLMIISLLIFSFRPLSFCNYFELLLKGGLVGIFIAIVFLTVNILFNINLTKNIILEIKKKYFKIEKKG